MTRNEELKISMDHGATQEESREHHAEGIDGTHVPPEPKVEVANEDRV